MRLLWRSLGGSVSRAWLYDDAFMAFWATIDQGLALDFMIDVMRTIPIVSHATAAGCGGDNCARRILLSELTSLYRLRVQASNLKSHRAIEARREHFGVRIK